MSTLTLDATVFLECDDATGEVRRITIQPSMSPIMVVDRGDATDEQIRNALTRAMNESWPPLLHLPEDVVWEGDIPWG